MTRATAISFIWNGDEAKIKPADLKAFREMAKSAGDRIYALDVLVDVMHEAQELYNTLLTQGERTGELQ